MISLERSGGMPGHQRSALEQIDLDMDSGFDWQGRRYENPDQAQRNLYVIGHLVDALGHEDMSKASLLCAYLARHMSDLAAVMAEEDGDEISVNLKFS